MRWSGRALEPTRMNAMPLNTVLKALAWPYRRWHHWRYVRATFDYFYYTGLISTGGVNLDEPDLFFAARAKLLEAEHAIEYHAARAGVTA